MFQSNNSRQKVDFWKRIILQRKFNFLLKKDQQEKIKSWPRFYSFFHNLYIYFREKEIDKKKVKSKNPVVHVDDPTRWYLSSPIFMYPPYFGVHWAPIGFIALERSLILSSSLSLCDSLPPSSSSLLSLALSLTHSLLLALLLSKKILLSLRHTSPSPPY